MAAAVESQLQRKTMPLDMVEFVSLHRACVSILYFFLLTAPCFDSELVSLESFSHFFQFILSFRCVSKERSSASVVPRTT